MDGELDARFGARLFRPNFEKRPRNLLWNAQSRNLTNLPRPPGVSAARRAAAQRGARRSRCMLYATTGGGEVQACPAVSVVTCRGVAR